MARIVSLIFFLYLGSTYGYNLKGTAANTIAVYEGTPLDIKKAPFMALYRPENETFHCGASIVNEKFLVTAAHCVDKEEARRMCIIVGTDNAYGGEKYEIENTFVHPNYSDGYFHDTRMSYDIAVIKLKDSLDFNDRVSPIAMVEPDFIFNHGDVVTAMGFGKTDNGNDSKTLLSVNLPYVNQMLCKVIYSMVGETVTDTMFCAGLNLKLSGTCQGDSGSPVIFNDTLVGVTSWGMGCGHLMFPDVSVRVSAFRSFIDDTIQNN